MKALAWMPAEHAVECVELPEPAAPADDQVVVRMMQGGLCGTDREIVRNELGALPPGADYLILGHESLGEVVDAGREVRSVRPGDRVAIAPRRPCAKPCPQCKRGRPDLCQSGQYREMGIDRLHGMFSEFVVERENYLYRLPPELHEIGVLMEPASVLEKALTRVGAARQALFGEAVSRRVLVLGAGPIGILAALLAKHQGSEVCTVSREDSHSRPARILETAGVTFSQPGAVVDGGFDCLVDCTGHPTAVFDHLHRLAPNSVVALVGAVPHGTRRQIDVGAFMTDAILKNQVFLGTVNADAASWRGAAADLAAIDRRHPGLLASLITHRFGWSQAPKAFFDRQEGEIKAVIEFGP